MQVRVGLLGIGLFLMSCRAADVSAPPAGNEMAPVQGGSGATPLPCNVLDVFQRTCWTCHGATTNFGAPMSLTSWEDTQATAKQDPYNANLNPEPVYQRIGERIHDTQNPMPQGTHLNAADLATLDAWVSAGAPAGSASDSCPAQTPTGAGGTSAAGGAPSQSSSGGAAPAGGAGGQAPTGTGGDTVVSTGGSGAISEGPPPANPDAGTIDYGDDVPVPPDPSECEQEMTFHARADATGAPYQVGANTVDLYECFDFHMDFAKPMQGLAFYPEIDNSQVIHHWLLYQTDTDQTATSGTNAPCLGWHPDSALLAGWAPGAKEWYLPKDVGVDMGSGNFILEVHYNNFNGPTTDHSGVRVCATSTARPKTAGISWLGTEIITIPGYADAATASSNCTPPTVPQPIHILRSWPHMHKLGVHMSAEITRAGGQQESLFDVPFNFNQQWQYDTPTIINQGDSIKTTCTYSNPGPNTVLFGESTTAEMCYNFTVAYPAYTLISTGLMKHECNNP